MYLYVRGPRLTCSLTLRPDFAYLDVTGEDPLVVRALFHELEEELNRYSYEFAWISGLLSRPAASAGTLLLFYVALVVGFCYTFSGFLPAGHISDLATIAQLPAMVLSFVMATLVGRAFPDVRFIGYFSDTSRRVRRTLYVLWTSLVVPILVRLVYDSFLRPRR